MNLIGAGSGSILFIFLVFSCLISFSFSSFLFSLSSLSSLFSILSGCTDGGSYYSCYGPYKQDSTSTKRGLVLDQDQCAGYRTDGTSRAIGRGVAESRGRLRATY